MARILDLNTDVAYIILSFLTQRDALNLACTCKDAYTLTLPRVVEDISIYPHRLPALAVSFANADNTLHRFKWMRQLTVRQDTSSVRGVFFPWQPASGSALAYILCNATRLLGISLEAAETAFIVHSPAMDALAGLPDLKELSLQQVDTLSLSVLPRMKNRQNIRALSLRNLPTHLQEFHRLAGLLSQWNSLYSLELCHTCFLRQEHPSSHRLLSLRSLTLKAGAAAMSSLAHVAPNLTSLSLHRMCDLGDQTLYWRYLDHAMGSFSDLSLLLGPATSISRTGTSFFRKNIHIRRVTVTDKIAALAFPYSTEIFLDLLADAEPIVLTIPVTMAVDEQFYQQLSGKLPKLRYLELQLSADDGAKLSGHLSWVESTARALSGLHLSGLHILTSIVRDGTVVKQASVWPIVISRYLPKLEFFGFGMGCRGDTKHSGANDLVSSWYHIAPQRDLPAEAHLVSSNTERLEAPTPSDSPQASRVIRNVPMELGDRVRSSLLNINSVEYAQQNGRIRGTSTRFNSGKSGNV